MHCRSGTPPLSPGRLYLDWLYAVLVPPYAQLTPFSVGWVCRPDTASALPCLRRAPPGCRGTPLHGDSTGFQGGVTGCKGARGRRVATQLAPLVMPPVLIASLISVTSYTHTYADTYAHTHAHAHAHAHTHAHARARARAPCSVAEGATGEDAASQYSRWKFPVVLPLTFSYHLGTGGGSYCA